MDTKYSEPIAEATGRPVSQIRQMLRSLRESELVPGSEGRPEARHIARVVMALGTDRAGHVVPLIEALQNLPRSVQWALPATAEDMLTSLVETLPRSPVLGDSLDVDGGFILIGADSVSIEALTLAGHRVVVRYGAPFAGIAARVVVPIDVIRKLITAVRNTT